MLDSGPINNRQRYDSLVTLGQAASCYRESVYQQGGFSGTIMQPLGQVMAMLDDDEAKAREIIATDNGFLAYAGSKHALCRALRRRATTWGEAGARLNGIAPGPIQTPMLDAMAKADERGRRVVEGLARAVPMGRLGAPEDVAGAVVFLVSEGAGFITGQTLSVSGGLTMA